MASLARCSSENQREYKTFKEKDEENISNKVFSDILHKA